MFRHASNSERPRISRRDLNRSPLIVFYEVTQACGLVCRHCRACAQAHADPYELSSSQSRELIGQLAEFPTPPMLVLTGGDPLCRDDIFELIEYATSVGLEVSITPSATPLVTEAAIRRLHDAGIHRLAISLDGADAATHDGVRGVAGSFSRSLQILRTARRYGIATQINTTITPDNVEQIDAMAALCAGLDIALWSVFFLVPVGRANNAARLSAVGCEQAFERLWNQSQQQSYLLKTTEAPHFRRFVAQRRRESKSLHSARADEPVSISFSSMGINDGKGIMFVSHMGKIYPSGFMPIDCGTFPRHNVVDVYQESPTFRALRNPDRLRGKCRLCEFRNICGGSRARAYAVSGDPLAEEPDCIYLPPQVFAQATNA